MLARVLKIAHEAHLFKIYIVRVSNSRCCMRCSSFVFFDCLRLSTVPSLPTLESRFPISEAVADCSLYIHIAVDVCLPNVASPSMPRASWSYIDGDDGAVNKCPNRSTITSGQTVNLNFSSKKRKNFLS